MPAHWLALAVLVVPQDPGPASRPDPLARLIADLRAAHLPGGARQPKAFDSRIVMTPLARDQDTTQVRLRVRYAEFGPKAKRIRYTLDEGTKGVERGNDAVGSPWEYDGEKLWSLSDKTKAETLAQFQRDLRLAQQLLRFLDPGALVASLENPSAVTEERLQWSRTAQPQCRVLEGTLSSMPLYFAGTAGAAGNAGSAAARVRAKLFVDQKTNLLTAVRFTALDEQGRVGPESEWAWFERWVERDGIRLPQELILLRTPAGAAPSQVKDSMKATFETLQLDPPLTERDFDRNRR